MRRLIFLNRYFLPDHSATSQILSDLAIDLVANGYDVHVVTSRLLYDDPKVRLPARELLHGVNVHRVPTTRFGRAGLPGRAADYLSFYISMWRYLLTIGQKNDVIIAKTDPPLLSIPASRAAKRLNARLVNWLHDLYPEIAVELGVPLLKGPAAWAIAAMRDQSLKMADANVVLGERMADRLRSRGVPPHRIHVIPNWSDDEQITPVSPTDNPLRREWNLQNHFVVGYSGNLGRAHEFHTVLNAAERLRSHEQIVFLFIGGGFQFDELVRLVKAKGLDRQFRFLPYQERDRLQLSLSVPDVHWISLKPNLEGLIYPSKLYGAAAAGRPIIAISAKSGEIARLVEQHACGFAVEPGDSDTLSESLLDLSRNAQQRETMGRRARAMLEEHFTSRQALARWRAVFANLK